MPLRYFGIRVRNLDRSLRFYGKALGLKEVSRGDMSEYGAGRWILLEDPRTHQRLELNWYPPSSRFATRYIPGEGLDHIGFLLGKVPRSRLEAEYRRLLAAGARPTPITPKLSDGWVANVKDPDGNWIEVFRWPTPAEIRAQARADKKKKPRDPKEP